MLLLSVRLCEKLQPHILNFDVSSYAYISFLLQVVHFCQMRKTFTTILLVLALLLSAHAASTRRTEAECNAACADGRYDEQCACFRQVFRWGKRARPYVDESPDTRALNRYILRSLHYFEGKLAHDFNADIFISNYNIILFGD